MILIYCVAYLVFIIPFTFWLSAEFNRKFDVFKNHFWLGAACVFGVLATLTSTFIAGYTGNFIQHFLGGGVACAFLTQYTIFSLNLKFNWRISLLFTLALTSILGTFNEIAEFLVQKSGVMTFAASYQDTWLDLTANISGCIFGFIITSIYLYFKKVSNNR